MKKSFAILLFSFTLLMVACDIKNEVASDSDDSVPQAAIAAVLQAFPEASSLKFTSIEAKRVWQAKFAIQAARMAVYVNQSGKIYEASQDAGASDLPAILLQYIQKMYPKAIILEAAKNVKDGAVTGYKVLIQIDAANKSETKTLLFDASGNLTLDVDPGNSGGTKTPTQSAVSYVVGLGDLPEAAKNTLSGYTFVKGLAYTYDGKTTYDVVVTKEGLTSYFVFDGNGATLKSYQQPAVNPTQSQALEPEKLPESIKTYLNQNYQGWTFTKGIVNLENGQVKSFLVVFQVVKDYYSAEFDPAGKLITIQKL